MAAGAKRHGLNVSASRATTGNHPLYGQLEKSIARFFGAQSATLTSNGYLPNLMAAQALAGQFSHALLDERAHASLVDASMLLDCPVLKFKHRDVVELARTLRRLGNIRPILLTDGMFTHDGSVAPLKKYLEALPLAGMMLVDDAHGAGVLGRAGRGTPEHEGVETERIIQTITLSKAFGVYGGAVLGSRKLSEAMIAGSRIFTGNTPLPLPLACAAIQSLEILKGGRSLRMRLARNANHLKAKLRASGFNIVETPGPIISVVPRDTREAARWTRRLLKADIYPTLIKYPGGPEGGYFRFAISSEHSRAQLDSLAHALILICRGG